MTQQLISPQSEPAPITPDIEDLLASFGLTDLQMEAARERKRDVAVTAGAGSGKTRTLVARYLPLLVESGSPRKVVAITFTEKAAREMRNRIRNEIRARIEHASAGEPSLWISLEAQMDAARIGTIHSLCSEILRAHPAEAGLDPQFSVLDEGIMAVLRVQAAKDALAWAVDQEEMRPIFALFKAATLETTLITLIERRLDMQPWLDGASLKAANPGIRLALEGWFNSDPVARLLQNLRALHAGQQLIPNAGEKLAGMVLDLLANFDQVETGLRQNDIFQAAQALYTARRQNMRGNLGSKGTVKDAVKELKELYDANLGWLGGKESKDPAPNPALDQQMAAALPHIFELYRHAIDNYLGALRYRNAVDFDMLEGSALELLEKPLIAARWQAEISAVLVDEFQDTNTRQRDLVKALCGEDSGRLFVVGDARQSIYRFRGADVTVFRDLQDEIRRQGGLSIDLDLTFRTHHGLLNGLGDLLGPIMGQDSRPGKPYFIPYSPLTARRSEPGDGNQAPYLEFVLAGGEDSDSGRAAAAKALARRLVALKADGQIHGWEEVTLLFRASTGFPAYEEAFEKARIPYVTTAGRGFFDRPEIRDVLNLLRVLADPWDDLALTGLLRSPAFGISKGGLYKLRWQDGHKTALYQALLGDLTSLDENDRLQATRSRNFLKELLPLVDRVPVDELLARVLTFTDYRAILAGYSNRLWRNLDKLLADARTSQIVPIRVFLEYLKTLKDVGAREGEAQTDADGAVRLMTIHKSKGLEFDVVVLADAARQGVTASETAYLMPETGLALKPDRMDELPLGYRFARYLDSDQSEAENHRLLYVALTRAKEKVIISGHLVQKEDAQDARGWLKDLLSAAGIDPKAAFDEAGIWKKIPLASGNEAGIWAENGEGPDTPQPAIIQTAEWPVFNAPPLFEPLFPDQDAESPNDEENGGIPDELSIWRATGNDEQLFGISVGQMVHKAIQRWLFPGDPGLEMLMKNAAVEIGLVEPEPFEHAMQEAAKMLKRFIEHPVWAEMDQAVQRKHEVPYMRLKQNGKEEIGYLDILYRTRTGWQIADFKTDTVRDDAELKKLVRLYSSQIRRYQKAVLQFLGPVENTRMIFLDNRGEVTVIGQFMEIN